MLFVPPWILVFLQRSQHVWIFTYIRSSVKIWTALHSRRFIPWAGSCDLPGLSDLTFSHSTQPWGHHGPSITCPIQISHIGILTCSCQCLNAPLTTSEGFVYFYPQRPLGCLFRPLSFQDLNCMWVSFRMQLHNEISTLQRSPTSITRLLFGLHWLPVSAASDLKPSRLPTKPKTNQNPLTSKHLTQPTLDHAPSDPVALLDRSHCLSGYKGDLHQDSANSGT